MDTVDEVFVDLCVTICRVAHGHGPTFDEGFVVAVRFVKAGRRDLRLAEGFLVQFQRSHLAGEFVAYAQGILQLGQFGPRP